MGSVYRHPLWPGGPRGSGRGGGGGGGGGLDLTRTGNNGKHRQMRS